MERDKIIYGLAIVALVMLSVSYGYNWALAELYRDYRGIYTGVVGDL